jgi:6,7-dimethyl-8-ribityllumazine synthase
MRLGAHVIALGAVSVTGKEITVTHTRYAFVKANGHADNVGKALDGFLQFIPAHQVDVFDLPGAFELPLMVRDLARSRKYAAVVRLRRQPW